MLSDMEWIHVGLSPYGRESFAWLNDGSVRRVVRDCTNGLRFLDCTHPWQNVCCDEGRVQAWRLADDALNPSLTSAQISMNEALQWRASGMTVWERDRYGLQNNA